MVELLKNEKLLLRTKPHPFSFWPYYAFFLYYIVVSAYIILNKEDIIAWFQQSLLSSLGFFGVEVLFVIIWWAILIIPALIVSIIRISWRWLIFYVLVAVVGTYLMHKYGASPMDLYYATIGIAVIGMLLTDLYRRGHEYILTNFRIIATLGFLGMKSRDVFYSRITDVVFEQDFLGKIFNYGTIVPVTASGIGTGEDAAKVAIGVGGARETPVATVGAGVAVEGEKTVTVARGRSAFILYGVPNPEEVRKMILENMAAKEAAPYLERTVELLEKLVEKKEEEGEEKK